MPKKALLVGNSDGMGLALTRRLLDKGWQVIGISRSPSPVSHPDYIHHVRDVSGPAFEILLGELSETGPVDLCAYFAGIGELLDPLDMGGEAEIIQVNFIGMVKTASAVVPGMVNRGKGHFLGISSLADEMVSAEAPSYYASKAGFSKYLAGLALALRPKGVHVTNVRFGFVDTKMAKGDAKPFLMSIEKAVVHLEHCLRKKPARYTAPKILIPLIKLRKCILALAKK